MSRCRWASLSSRSVTQSAGVIPYNGSNTSSSAQVNFARPRETTRISTSHYAGTQKRPLPLYPHDAQRMKHMLRPVVVFTYCVVICCITLSHSCPCEGRLAMMEPSRRMPQMSHPHALHTANRAQLKHTKSRTDARNRCTLALVSACVWMQIQQCSWPYLCSPHHCFGARVQNNTSVHAYTCEWRQCQFLTSSHLGSSAPAWRAALTSTPVRFGIRSQSDCPENTAESLAVAAGAGREGSTGGKACLGSTGCSTEEAQYVRGHRSIDAATASTNLLCAMMSTLQARVSVSYLGGHGSSTAGIWYILQVQESCSGSTAPTTSPSAGRRRIHECTSPESLYWPCTMLSCHGGGALNALLKPCFPRHHWHRYAA